MSVRVCVCGAPVPGVPGVPTARASKRARWMESSQKKTLLSMQASIMHAPTPLLGRSTSTMHYSAQTTATPSSFPFRASHRHHPSQSPRPPLRHQDSNRSQPTTHHPLRLPHHPQHTLLPAEQTLRSPLPFRHAAALHAPQLVHAQVAPLPCASVLVPAHWLRCRAVACVPCPSCSVLGDGCYCYCCCCCCCCSRCSHCSHCRLHHHCCRHCPGFAFLCSLLSSLSRPSHQNSPHQVVCRRGWCGWLADEATATTTMTTMTTTTTTTFCRHASHSCPAHWWRWCRHEARRRAWRRRRWRWRFHATIRHSPGCHHSARTQVPTQHAAPSCGRDLGTRWRATQGATTAAADRGWWTEFFPTTAPRA